MVWHDYFFTDNSINLSISLVFSIHKMLSMLQEANCNQGASASNDPMLEIEVGGDELVLEELGQQAMEEDREDVRLPVSVVEMSSQSIQVPEIPRRAYKEAEQRTQQKMRAKAIDNLSALANQFVNFIPSDVPSFICDLVQSGK